MRKGNSGLHTEATPEPEKGLTADSPESSAGFDDPKHTQGKLNQVEANVHKLLNQHAALQEANKIITSTLELDEVIHRIAEQICEAVNATSTYILDVTLETGETTVIAEYYSQQACDAERESDLGTTYIESETGFLRAMERGIPWINHVDDPEAPKQDQVHMQKYGAKSILYIPLVVRSSVVGAVEVWESRDRRQFTKEEIDLCFAIAQNAGIAITNARLYGQVKFELDERQRTEKTLREVNAKLEALVDALEVRTAEHAEANKLLQQEIAERARAEASLRESEERYILAARGANDGLWDWNLDTDQIYFSPRWKAMLGYEEDMIEDHPHEWFDRIHPDELMEFQLAMSAHMKGMTDQFEIEYRIQHQDGYYRWMLCRGLAIRDEAGNAYRIAGSQTDITERKHAEAQLTHDALHDTLTGLPNRTLLLERLERAIDLSKRHDDYMFALLFLDIDRFKNINDTLGHIVGDKILQSLADRLLTCLRNSDTVARIGGDEFVILLENYDEITPVSQVVDRIQKDVSLPIRANGHEVFVSSSIGIVLNDGSYERAGDILRDADIAMYTAKGEGGNHNIVFAAEMRDSIIERMRIENELRNALNANEFQLHYQPIISLTNGKLTGFEALIRWNHPEMGLISPASFIPIAEETRLINPIGNWVLQNACRQLRIWQEQYPSNPPLTMSVNLSIVQFSQTDFIDQIEYVLDDNGLNASNLIIEITESALIKENTSVIRTISILQDLGVRVHIDDFGTGYSSLGYLQRFPIDIIKIDRSFINKINGDNENTEIVRAILNLAHELNLSVIAEGIETENQLNTLKRFNCEFGQGFLLSEPMDSRRLESWLSLNAKQITLSNGDPLPKGFLKIDNVKVKKSLHSRD